jgi:hypothetical protein
MTSTAGSLAQTPALFNQEIDDMLLRISVLEQQLTDPGTTTANASVVAAQSGIVVVVITQPSVPTGITLTPGAFANNVYVDASWTPPSDGSAVAYEVELAKKVSGSYQTVQATRTNGNTVRFNALEPNVTYGFRIATVSNSSLISAFVPATGYTDVTTGHDSTVPAQAAGLAVYAGVKSLIARWNMNTEPDVVNGYGTYKIDCATDAGFTNIVKTNTSAGQVTSFDDLASNTTYYVRVAAIDSSGNQGPYSASASGTTGQISNPDIVAGTITGDRIAASTITAANILAATITGDKIAANTIDANSIKTNTILAASLSVTGVMTPGGSGGISIGTPPSYGVFIGPSGIRGYSGYSNTFILDSSGNATFSGTLSGTVINSGYISGGVVTGAIVRTAGSGMRVELNSSSSYISNGVVSGSVYSVDLFSTSTSTPGKLYDFSVGGAEITLLECGVCTSGAAQQPRLQLTSSPTLSQCGAVLFGQNISITGGAASGQVVLNGSYIQVNAQGSSGLYLGSSGTITLSASSTIGVYGPTTVNNAFAVTGTSYLTGVLCSSLSCSGSKSFVIEHPLMAAKHLVHACLEGPENAIFYRGEQTVGKDGSVVVKLPDYFEALTAATDRSVQLTPIAKADKSPVQPLSAARPVAGSFMVVGEPGQEFWWEVKAIRADIEPLEVEPTKKAMARKFDPQPPVIQPKEHVDAG